MSSAQWALVWVMLVVVGCGSRRALPGDSGAAVPDAPVRDVRVTDAPVIIPVDVARRDSGLSLTERVVRACAFAEACSVKNALQITASQCVEWFAYRDWPRGGYAGIGSSLLDHLLSCAPAADCKAFSSCYGGTWIGPTVCREGGQCQNDMLYSASNNALLLHCNALGGSCMDLATGAIRACCALKTCPVTEKTTCHPNPGGSSTKGTHCLLGIAYDFDCAPMGQSCSTIPGQLCVGSGGFFCNPNNTPVSCNGSVAKYCVPKYTSTGEIKGTIAKVDCATTVFHSACNQGIKTADPCRPAGTECNAGYLGECQGTKLLVCVDGYKVPVDCGAIGFDLCGLPPLAKRPSCMYAL